MSDLISRKETIRYIRENLPLSTFMHRGVKQADIACWDVCNMIADRVPSAEEQTAKVKKVDEINVHCGNCDTPLGDWWTYCPSCGAKLEWE